MAFCSRRVRPQLALEALEARTLLSSATVVPLTQSIDNRTTFFRIEDALAVATNAGDVVTLEPGVASEPGPVQITNSGITVQGDPASGTSGLPAYDFILSASHVTLSRLNIGSVTINPDFSNDAVVRSHINNVTMLGGPTGAGGNVIDRDTISGSVVMTGTLSALQQNNSVTSTTFDSSVPNTTNAIISVQDNSGVIIRDNVINGNAAAPQDGIVITRGVNHLVANNTITLTGTSLTTHGIVLQNPGGSPLVTATIANNRISTGNGVGLFLNAFNDTTLQALVQGNDFKGNAVGVDYLAGGTSSIASDLGGGSNNLGSSLGGNDFRGFPLNASADNAAIRFAGPSVGVVMAAQMNIFDDPQNANNAVFVNGLAGIDVTQTLTGDRAFIQSLYNDLPGRTGGPAELDSWEAILTAGADGRTNVVNGIMRSDEALGRVVDSYYLKYLDRPADRTGRAYWIAVLRSGADIENVQAAFVNSAEFRSQNSAGVVQALYRTFFDRTATAGELTFWYGVLQRPNGLAVVASKFALSAENRDRFVDSGFAAFLHRAAADVEKNFFANEGMDLRSLEEQILTSPEFFQRG
jgi:hypothetical protein